MDSNNDVPHHPGLGRDRWMAVCVGTYVYALNDLIIGR